MSEEEKTIKNFIRIGQKYKIKIDAEYIVDETSMYSISRNIPADADFDDTTYERIDNGASEEGTVPVPEDTSYFLGTTGDNIAWVSLQSSDGLQYGYEKTGKTGCVCIASPINYVQSDSGDYQLLSGLRIQPSSKDYQVIIGKDNQENDEALFIVGNGIYSHKSNALEIYEDDIKIGQSSQILENFLEEEG